MSLQNRSGMISKFQSVSFRSFPGKIYDFYNKEAVVSQPIISSMTCKGDEMDIADCSFQLISEETPCDDDWYITGITCRKLNAVTNIILMNGLACHYHLAVGGHMQLHLDFNYFK